MFDPDISTRSINRAPPRGSLTGTVGLFPLWKQKKLSSLLNSSFYDRHLLPHLHCARPPLPENCLFHFIVSFFPLSRNGYGRQWRWAEGPDEEHEFE